MSSKKAAENEEKLNQAMNTINLVVNNTNIPRNIRKVTKEVVDGLHDKRVSIGVRAANAMSVLEEVSQDPNVPSFARVTLWNAVSVLEGIRE